MPCRSALALMYFALVRHPWIVNFLAFVEGFCTDFHDVDVGTLSVWSIYATAVYLHGGMVKMAS